ncbi:MAG: zinc ABC transporter substrate-binding protein [Chloroflexi bacterium]|nr:zinc ABC transporter substrate-binding protein [Chloroflexota bacterium]
MRRKAVGILAIFLATLALSISTGAQGATLEVVASHSILADVLGNIAGDHVELTTLIPIGADPHGFNPSPSDLTSVAEADLVFVNGAGFEETLLEVIKGAAEDVPIVEVSACVEIIAIGATGHMHEDDKHADEHDDEDAHDDDEHADEHDDEDTHDDDDHADEHDDEDAHDDDDHADEHDDEDAHDDDDHADMDSHCDAHDAEFVEIMGDEDAHQHGPVLGRLEDIDCGAGHGHGDGGHAHGAGDCDPHVWMDPHNVTYWSLMIRDVLSELDPGHASDYAAAAAEYIGELVALESDFILPLLEELPVEQRILITSHDSLGYLAATFDFQIISTVIPGGSTLVEPSARDVAALIDLINETGVAAIFGETTVSTSEVETIAAETGAELAIIYSGTLSDGGPASTYLEYMRYNLGTIVEALG